MEELVLKLTNEENKLIERLGSLETGTEEYANVLQDLSNVNELLIKLDKHQNDATFDKDKFIEEFKLEKKKHRFNVTSSCIGNAVAVVSVVLPLVCYGAWLKQGYKFEEEGVISSTTTKGLLSKLRPTK